MVQCLLYTCFTFVLVTNIYQYNKYVMHIFNKNLCCT